MKKLLTALFFAATLGGTNAEAAKTYFSENFEKDISGTWTMIDGDKLTLDPNIAQVLNQTTISWERFQISATNSVALSCSYHSPAGTSDDWLISPEITVEDKTMLEWSATSIHPSLPADYEVLVSTGGTNVEDFVKVATITAEETSFTRRSVDLGKLGYTNKKIRVAFRNNSTQKYYLLLDDVLVSAPDDHEVSLIFTSINDAPKLNEDVIISPYIRTRSYLPLNSVDVTYEVDGEAPVTNTVDMSAVTFNAYKGFNLGTKWTAAKLGNRSIKVTLSNVNGNNATEGTTEDNSITYQSYVWDNTNITAVHPLIESFTSATCAPCASLNATFNPFLKSNSENLAYIKYQMDWPGNGDKYYNEDGGMRKDYYGVESVPDRYANGFSFSSEDMTTDGVNSLKSDPGLFNIINPVVTFDGKKVNVKAEIEPVGDMTGANIRYHVAIVEKKTTGNVSTNGETEFFNVMQKMLPNGNGTAVTALAKGAKQSIDLSYTFDAATSHVEEYDDLAVIVFVQNVYSGRIIQSAWAVQSTSSVEGNNDGNGIVALYPNPATDLVKVQYALAQDQEVSIEIVDVAGATVANVNKGMLSAGYYTEGLDINNLSSGKYFVRMNIGGKLFTDVITISK